MHTRITVFFVLTSAVLLQAFITSGPTVAHFILYNDSNKEIPLYISISNPGKANSVKTYHQIIKPGMQEFEAGKFEKNTYLVSIESDNGKVSLSKTVTLDADRWIIINYTSRDSVSIVKKYGFLDTNSLKKIDGMYTGLDMFSETRRPPNL